MVDSAQQAVIDRVQRSVVQRYGRYSTPSTGEIATLVREHAGLVSDEEVLRILRAVRNDSTGVGVLESLVSHPETTDVLVNGPNQVWVERGNGLELTALRFVDEAALRRLATRLVVGAGGRLDDAHPYADARLPRADGTALRVHAVIPPLAHGGTALSLRVLRPTTLDLAALVRSRTVPREARRLLLDLLARRRAFLITGGTGSGKTTLLAALLAEVPGGERIVCIEDTPEISPRVHPHVVALAARGANVEGRGEVTLTTLVRQALRMRPDRIVVGEIRGPEIVDLLAALNTGHDGGAGTLHANSLAEVPARLEALCALGGLRAHEAHAQILAAIHTVLVMHRGPEGRRLVQVGELVAATGSGLAVRTVWEAP